MPKALFGESEGWRVRDVDVPSANQRMLALAYHEAGQGLQARVYHRVAVLDDDASLADQSRYELLEHFWRAATWLLNAGCDLDKDVVEPLTRFLDAVEGSPKAFPPGGLQFMGSEWTPPDDEPVFYFAESPESVVVTVWEPDAYVDVALASDVASFLQ